MEIRGMMTRKGEKISRGKQLWHILRALFYMLRNAISKHHLFMDLNIRLLVNRGKTASRRFLASGHHRLDSLSCRSVDPAEAYYSPKEVEFSCSNTPMAHPFFHHHHHHHRATTSNKRMSSQKRVLEAEAIARAFEMLNSMETAQAADQEDNLSAITPSPAAAWRHSSPVVGRQLRVTDSPFPVRSEEEEGESQVDREAEEFIKRFYEQLRLQQE